MVSFNESEPRVHEIQKSSRATRARPTKPSKNEEQVKASLPGSSASINEHDGSTSSSLMKKLREFISDITKIPNIEDLKFPP